MFYPSNFETDIWEAEDTRATELSPNRQAPIALAFSEAWAWAGSSGSDCPRRRYKRAQWIPRPEPRAGASQSEAEFANYAVARMLSARGAAPENRGPSVDGVHARGIRCRCFPGQKAVEVVVRDATGLPDSLLGTKLMQAAFAPENGPLTDISAEGGERSGRLQFFVGAIACYKNPPRPRHRFERSGRGGRIILLANHLLRIVDARANAKSGKP